LLWGLLRHIPLLVPHWLHHVRILCALIWLVETLWHDLVTSHWIPCCRCLGTHIIRLVIILCYSLNEILLKVALNTIILMIDGHQLNPSFHVYRVSLFWRWNDVHCFIYFIFRWHQVESIPNEGHTISVTFWYKVICCILEERSILTSLLVEKTEENYSPAVSHW
jgi:hypothetical protein